MSNCLVITGTFTECLLQTGQTNRQLMRSALILVIAGAQEKVNSANLGTRNRQSYSPALGKASISHLGDVSYPTIFLARNILRVVVSS